MKGPNKRLHTSLILTLVLSMLLLGTVNSFAQPVVIEHLLKGEGEGISDATREVAALFNEIQDEVHVELTVGPASPGAYVETVALRTVGGNPPDVMAANRPGDLGANNLAYPLNEFIERDGVDEIMVPGALDLVSWEGDVITLPQFVQPLVTYYNEILFQEAALHTPAQLADQGDWTWDRVVEAGRLINKDSNFDGDPEVWGVGAGMYSLTRSAFWISLAGGYVFDTYSNPTESRFNSEEVRTALEFLWSMVHEQNATPVEAVVSGQFNQRFPQGRVGMSFEGPWHMGVNTEWNDWDLAPLPHGPVNASTLVQVDGVQIARTTENPDAAWTWISFLATDPRSVEIFTTVTGRPPSVMSQLPIYESLISVDGQPNASVIAEALMGESIPLTPVSEHFTQLDGAYGPEVVAYFRGQQGLGQTVERVHDAFNRIFSGQ